MIGKMKRWMQMGNHRAAAWESGSTKKKWARSPGLNLVYKWAEGVGVSKEGEGEGVSQPQLHVRIFHKVLLPFSCGGSPPWAVLSCDMPTSPARART